MAPDLQRMANTLNLTIQFIDAELNPADITEQVEILSQRLLALKGMGRLSYIKQSSPEGHAYRQGIHAPALDASHIRPVLGQLCDRLKVAPLQTRLQVKHGESVMQVNSCDADVIARHIPLVEKLIAPTLIYQGWAEYYAREGEISPVAQANLDLLQHQLDIEPNAAAEMIAKALGPYHNREEKLQRYREVLADQVAYHYPLTEEAQAELKRFYESLNLTHADIEPIETQYLLTVHEAEAKVTQLQAEVTRLQDQTTTLQSASVQMESTEETEAQQHLANLKNYQGVCLQILQNSLDISDFNQGRLEQARRDWHLSPEEAREIEWLVAAECYGSITSERGADYTRLRSLLWQGKWQEADQETERMILQIASEDMRPISRDTLLYLPETDLKTIDQLWARYSQNRFGLTAQQTVYEGVDKIPATFLQAVGWQEGWGWGDFVKVTKAYRELRFGVDAPRGHLPTWRWACTSLESGYSIGADFVDSFFVYLAQHFPLADGYAPITAQAVIDA
ncbi:MAG: GUN4 domain-containing protein [Cyanobacteria bacterium J06642_9]